MKNCMKIDVKGGSKPDPRQGHRMCKISEEEFIIHGGRVSSYHVTGDIWIFNITKKTWKLIDQGNDPKTLPRSGHSVLYNPFRQKLLIFCGRNNGYLLENYLNDSFEYDLKNGGYKKLNIEDLPRLNSSGSLYDKKRHCIYLVCGRNINGENNHIYKFDLNNYKLKRIDDPKQNFMPKRKASVCEFYDDSIIIFGGQSGTLENEQIKGHNDMYCFDLCTKMIKVYKCFGQVPSPRNGSCSCIRNNKLFVIGGSLDNQLSNLDGIIHILNLITKKWTTQTIFDYSVFNNSFGSSIICDNKLTLFGGSETYHVTNDIYQYEFSVKEELPSLPNRLFVKRLKDERKLSDLIIFTQL